LHFLSSILQFPFLFQCFQFRLELTGLIKNQSFLQVWIDQINVHELIISKLDRSYPENQIIGGHSI